MAPNKWACWYSIPVIHPEPGRMYGQDALEAFDNTLRFVRNLIHGSIEDGFQIWWQDKDDKGGF